MRVLTLKPQFARAVLAGTKTREYRSWPISWRGPLVIHSGRPDGVLLCLVTVTECVSNERRTGYVWHLANVRPIEPIAAKGKLRIWYVPDSLVRPHSLVRPLRPRKKLSTLIVNLRHKEAYDVYIGRACRGRHVASIFGNPYKSLSLFKDYFLQRLKDDPAFREKVLALKGKRLACWCAPPGGLTARDPVRCHGQIIAAYLDGRS